MAKNIYYVYAYLDPTKEGEYHYGEYNFPYEPFYIGKGNGDRLRIHLKGNKNNRELVERIESIKGTINVNPVIVKLWEDLREDDAYAIEWKAIKTIGTVYSKSFRGPLLNKAFTNVFDAQIYGNVNTVTYALEHPYIQDVVVIMGKFKLFKFCEEKGLNMELLLMGKSIDGWSLTEI